MFYRLATWKKIIIMLGGPAMNGVLALALTAGTISGHGTNMPTTQVAEVFECVTSVEAADAEGGTDQQECTEADPPGPAYEAGLRPGDTILEFGGQPVQEWDELTPLIREAAGGPARWSTCATVEHATVSTPSNPASGAGRTGPGGARRRRQPGHRTGRVHRHGL